MRNKWNCSWSTIQLFKKFFSLLRSIRIDLFLLFTFGCSYSCFIHWHIVSLNGPCDTIRTCDHCVPNAELYQAELHTVNTGAGRESRTPRSSAWKAAGRPLSCLPALLSIIYSTAFAVNPLNPDLAEHHWYVLQAANQYPETIFSLVQSVP